MELPRAIRIIRGNETQPEFAARIGVHRNALVMWETGRFAPNIENLRKLVSAGLDAHYLVGNALDVPPITGIRAEAGHAVAQ